MSENRCVRCDRPTPDGYACSPCAYRAGDQLHELADMAPAARDVAHGLAHRGDGGGTSGKPGSSMPFNTMSTEKLTKIQARLSTWVREVAHARSRPIPAPRHLGDDQIVLWARWLAGHVDWMRKTDDAERFLIEVDECARAMWSVVRGPAEQKYLGPCGAVLSATAMPCPDECSCQSGPRTALSAACAGCWCLTACHPTVQTGAEGEICDGDVRAYDGAKVGRCRACGAEVATSEREDWLDGEVRQHAFRAAHIADAYDLNVNTIRSWATAREELRDREGRVTQYARPARLLAHDHDFEGRPRYLVGDVLDLAAAEAARRATEQAKRARRAAVKAAECEGDEA